jgi:hypothetical protein
MEFRERWEELAEKEYDFYMAQPASFIEEAVRSGNFGNYYQIWEVVPSKLTLEKIGWDLFSILKTDSPYLTRFHCAQALVQMAESAPHGIQAAMISAEAQFNVPQNLEILKTIIENKLAGK